jgi:hypothetical protein
MLQVKQTRRGRIVIFAALTLFLGGCTASKALFAMARGTGDFHALKSDPRVRYETGAEDLAKRIAANLDHAIKLIDTKQYGPFVKPVVVYVPNTVKRFAGYCMHASAGGCVLNERLFISPKKANTPQRIPHILAHELSHLHMEQRLGMWHLQSKLPPWFQEGLAVYASDGCCTEGVSGRQARQAIITGSVFTPTTSGSLLFRKTAHSYGLKPHMFYKEAGIFISWLHEQGNGQFKSLLQTIQAGASLEDAMHKAYGAGVVQEWKLFVSELKQHRESAGSAHDVQAVS